jgi:hypothetical protein
MLLKHKAQELIREARYQNKKFWKELRTYFLLISHEPHRKWRTQHFFYCCVCIHRCGNVSTELLPSNNRGLHIHTQTDGRDLWSTLLRWAQVPWYTYQVSGIQKLIQGDSQKHIAHKPTFIFSKYGKKAKKYVSWGRQLHTLGPQEKLINYEWTTYFTNTINYITQKKHEKKNILIEWALTGLQKRS